MAKKRVYLSLSLIIILALGAFVFDFPEIVNRVPGLGERVPDVPFKLGLDLQGGVHLIYEADLSQIESQERGEAMEGLRDVIERRVNLFGVREPLVQVQKKGEGFRLVVELAGVIDPVQAIAMIGQTPFLEFKEQRPPEETEKILAKQKELEGLPQEEWEQFEGWQLALEDPYFKATNLTGRYLKGAQLGFDRTTQEPLVSLQFDEEGAKIFETLTEKNVGQVLAIYIDDILISAPVVQQKIAGGRAQITGRFTIDEAKKLARDLSAGALPVPIDLISQQQVGPSLGAVSLQKSLGAGFLGFLAVGLFMLLFYRLPGLLAVLSLTFYALFTLALFKLMGVTLTLAGIGGFILSVGMAIDANILIFARFKEERAESRALAYTLPRTFGRAWPSIRDGNLTTLLVALILFSFGTSFVKGFAMTLSLGILLSMVAAMLFTRLLMEFACQTRLEKVSWLWR